MFGELSYDFIPDVLTGTIGGRHFRSENSLKGFFGFSDGWFPGATYGEAMCVASSATIRPAGRRSMARRARSSTRRSRKAATSARPT